MAVRSPSFLLVAAGLLAGCSSYAAPPPKASFLPAAFRASGTEPFWSVEVTPLTLVYTTPDDCAGDGGCQGREAVPVRTDYAGKTIVLAQLDDGELHLTITPGPCNDGMSDKEYPWTVVARRGESIWPGCADSAGAKNAAAQKN